MTSVMCSGFGSAAVLPQQLGYPSGPGVAELDLRRPVEDLVDLVRERVDGYGPLVMVKDARDTLGLQALLAIRALTAAPLLVVPVALPQLALLVTALSLSALLPDEPAPTLLADLVPEIAARLQVLARVSSVAGLRDPAPHLTQHARSMLPGGSFQVCVQPLPSVTAWGSGPDVQLPPVAPESVAVLRGDEDGSVRARVLASWPGTPLVELPAAVGASAWWGSRKAVELVAAPLVLAPLRAQLLAPALPCRWCHQLSRAAVCSGCSMLRIEDSGRTA